MANFGQMRDNLRLQLMGGLGLVLEPDDTYSKLINRAHTTLVEAYDWSFRLSNTVVNTVPPKSNGTVTLTIGSPSILGTGTSFTYADVGGFLWLGSGGGGNTPLPISDVAGLQLASLANPFSGPSVVQVGYTTAQRYYLIENALEVLSVVSEDFQLQKRLLAEINDLDPCRTDQGGSPAVLWCNAPPSPDGSVMIELWPIAADYRPYLVTYRCKAPKLVRDSDLPLIDSTLVEEQAMVMGCEMMAASTGQQSWFTIRQLHYQNLYGDGGNNIGKLSEALIADSRRQQYLPGVTNPGPFMSGYDGSYTPSHAGGDWDI